jgi:hypothetical protein
MDKHNVFNIGYIFNVNAVPMRWLKYAEMTAKKDPNEFPVEIYSSLIQHL